MLFVNVLHFPDFLLKRVGVCERSTWSVEEEKQLREMLQEHRRLNEIAAFFGKSPESVKKKTNHLNLVVVVLQIPKTTTSNDLPSVEKALQSKPLKFVKPVAITDKTNPVVLFGSRRLPKQRSNSL